MKKNTLFFIIMMLSFGGIAQDISNIISLLESNSGNVQRASNSDDILNKVNVMIGTGANGAVIPVAVVPHGMVQLGPDTRNGGSGYHYNDKTIIGFSHTHKSGGGCNDFQDIMLQPTSGELKLDPGTEDNPDAGYRSRFSHKEEIAEPGLYRVKLADYNTDVALTATERCGFHRYNFPKGKSIARNS